MVGNLQLITKSLLGQWFCNAAPLPSTNFHQKAECPAPEESEENHEPTLRIIDLPSDVLFSIADHLDTPSVHSLSLTCRDLYACGFPATRRPLDPADKQQLLITLERDPLGDSSFYCQMCNKLHRYEQTWGPQSEAEKAQNARGTLCGMKDSFAPVGNPFGLGHHHARLVMNSHFYGPQFGLPLGAICVEQTAVRGKTPIRCSTAANIIQDELYIRRTYSFTVDEDAADDFFSSSQSHRDFRLCEHMPFLRSASAYRQAIPELQRRRGAAPGADLLFSPCRNSPGSCGICLLDYDITIQQQKQQTTTGDAGAGAWDITIHAFHQVGSCRSPDDWKWSRFTEATRTRLFALNRPNRRGSKVHPGLVRATWLRAPAMITA